MAQWKCNYFFRTDSLGLNQTRVLQSIYAVLLYCYNSFCGRRRIQLSSWCCGVMPVVLQSEVDLSEADALPLLAMDDLIIFCDVL